MERKRSPTLKELERNTTTGLEKLSVSLGRSIKEVGEGQRNGGPQLQLRKKPSTKLQLR